MRRMRTTSSESIQALNALGWRRRWLRGMVFVNGFPARALRIELKSISKFLRSMRQVDTMLISFQITQRHI